MWRMCFITGGQYFSSRGGTQCSKAEQLLLPGSRVICSSDPGTGTSYNQTTASDNLRSHETSVSNQTT